MSRQSKDELIKLLVDSGHEEESLKDLKWKELNELYKSKPAEEVASMVDVPQSVHLNRFYYANQALFEGYDMLLVKIMDKHYVIEEVEYQDNGES